MGQRWGNKRMRSVGEMVSLGFRLAVVVVVVVAVVVVVVVVVGDGSVSETLP